MSDMNGDGSNGTQPEPRPRSGANHFLQREREAEVLNTIRKEHLKAQMDFFLKEETGMCWTQAAVNYIAFLLLCEPFGEKESYDFAFSIFERLKKMRGGFLFPEDIYRLKQVAPSLLEE